MAVSRPMYEELRGSFADRRLMRQYGPMALEYALLPGVQALRLLGGDAAARRTLPSCGGAGHQEEDAV